MAASARQFVVVVDHTKQVPHLGTSFPLPIEVVPFGWGSTARHIEAVEGRAVLRERNGRVFQTEAGHYIVDLHLGAIHRPAELEARLNQIPGVVETGLFIGRRVSSLWEPRTVSRFTLRRNLDGGTVTAGYGRRGRYDDTTSR